MYFLECIEEGESITQSSYFFRVRSRIYTAMKTDIDIQYVFHHLKWVLIKMIFILNRNL